MSKTALVVDDSQVARHVLSNLLVANGIVADSAESGESALDYLKHQRPDVIFMDHNMPGIDGFQALEAIKANPATATIPVMMYTSQEGELYVGQARALGAFGVLPKGLKPIELTQVLKALHLVPADRSAGPAPQPPAVPAAQAPAVTELLEELFRQQRLALGAEIRESHERVVAAAREQQPKEIALPPPPQPRRATSLHPPAIAAVVLGVLAAFFAYMYASTARLLQETSQRSSGLLASAVELASANVSANVNSNAALASPGGQSKPAFAAGAADLQIVALIEWTLNENNTYGFDEIALDEVRADKLARAIEYAASAGLSGTLSLRVHTGRFCMTYGSGGTAELAEPTLPVAQCQQLGWLASDAFALGRRQTLAFANIVMGAQSGTNIRVETSSMGNDEPAVPYPNVTADITAGEWNRVAAANHRIDIRFVEDNAAQP